MNGGSDTSTDCTGFAGPTSAVNVVLKNSFPAVSCGGARAELGAQPARQSLSIPQLRGTGRCRRARGRRFCWTPSQTGLLHTCNLCRHVPLRLLDDVSQDRTSRPPHRPTSPKDSTRVKHCLVGATRSTGSDSSSALLYFEPMRT